MARATRNVKYERHGSPTASLTSETMPPPSPSSRKRKSPPPSDVQDNCSTRTFHTFNRSMAPSAETHQRRDEDELPILMQMKSRQDSFRAARQGSPASQAADASFVQQSFAHTSFADIGLKQKACNDTLGNLQMLGVSHVAALPELVLVGDQSSGKSSLMSGLARVNLPRSAGVCTRCPLHIRLISSKTDHWSCTVSLQQDYDFKPFPERKPRVSDVTKMNPFPPWAKMSHRDIKPFKTIYDPSQIEEVLRWAQIAILNHNQSYEAFIPGEGFIAKGKDLDVAAHDTDAQFSPNIVALEMKGPGLPDLSFYDLPGVFQSPEKEEDEYVVRVVENLTLEYIRREKAIIMWAVPMNVDIENSICLNTIRKAKASDRTIGVMTKADQLPSQNIPNWLATFKGSKVYVGHGYFATARPPGQALENATRWEELFFKNDIDGNPSWPLDFNQFADRCGVEVLLKYLSCKLGEAFTESLPSIKNMVFSRLKEIQADLAALPELPRNVEYEVKKSLFDFLVKMKAAVEDDEFLSEWNTLNNQFRSCVIKIKPTCKVKDNDLQTIDISGADSEVATPSPSKRPRPSDSTMRTPTRRQNQDVMSTPVKNEDYSIGGMSRASSVTAIGPSSQPNPFTRFHNLGRLAMDIKDIRTEIALKKRPGLPSDLVPVQVRENLCLKAVRNWEKPLETYITKTAELLGQTANNVLETSLGSLRRRLIFRSCQKHLKEFLGEMVASQESRLQEMFDTETYQLYMMNEDVFKRYKMQEMEQLNRVRGIIRLKAVTLLDWGYSIRKPEEMSEEDRVKERKLLDAHLPKLPKDPYETEIEVAGFVRGYYMMAAARFVEGVTMNVNWHLLRAFREQQLDEYLDREFQIFGSSDPALYGALMEEDEKTARRREQLKGEMDKLSRAMNSINDLESSSSTTTYRNSNSAGLNSDSEMEETLFVA
ncbi:P-loop containing nucleoside triphosphate hydrolase protein [Hypomontagnella monticulosa]|nr:P-loop containing nucleoside triphosphate hydrolase protein [Hypomontagnella monticulosa]